MIASRRGAGLVVRSTTKRDWSSKVSTAASEPGGSACRRSRARSRARPRSLAPMLPDVSRATTTIAGGSAARLISPAMSSATNAQTRKGRISLRPNDLMSHVAYETVKPAGVEGVAATLQCCAIRMPPRTPFRNNARLVLATTVAVGGLLVLIEILLRKSRDFSPDFLASVLLYGLTVLNLTLLLILVFVLGRNLVRVILERRRRVLGARFRLRLVLVFLLMATAPSVLLIFVGTDLIQQTVDRWFNVDVERILSSSQALGTAFRESVSERNRVHGRALARELQ